MTAPVPTSTDPTTTATDPAGATPPAPAATPPTPPATGPDDKPLGPGGEAALKAEREKAKALEKQLGELKPLLDFVSQIRGGQAVPDSQKTESEQLAARLAEVEKTAADERMARIRLEVAGEKRLTAAQAAWLKGATKEELTTSADELLALFPAATPATPGTPRPDPSQGVRSAGPPDLDALIAEAEAKGDTRTAIQLKVRKLTKTK